MQNFDFGSAISPKMLLVLLFVDQFIKSTTILIIYTVTKVNGGKGPLADHFEEKSVMENIVAKLIWTPVCINNKTIRR